jgi:hypothetical protein
MIDLALLVPEDGTIGRGCDGWHGGRSRGGFTPNERMTIPLYRFNPAGSFPLPVVYGIFFVPGFK